MMRTLPILIGLFALNAHAQTVSHTDKPHNDAPGTFRFAIMSDRTGGMLPGVFEKGADKVNLMQPEFVLSVGDLVDGYTTDPAVWNAQWDEFEAIVNRLDMRFYYVPGNHDISNPQVAHLALDGIHDKHIVTDENNRKIQALRMGRWMAIDPIRNPSNTFTETSTVLRFTNSEPEPMRITGTLPPRDGIRFEPSLVDLTVAPNADSQLALRLIADVPVSIQDLNNARSAITLSAAYLDRGRELSLPTTVPLRMDWTHRIGDTLHVTHPVFMQEDWDWRGPDDGRFQVSTRSDRQFLHVDIRAWDDRILLPSRDRFSTHQDQFHVHVMLADGRTLKIRTAPGLRPDRPLLEVDDKRIPIRAQSAVFEDGSGIGTTVSIPLRHLPTDRVRLNIGWMDHDRPENTKPSVLWLHPVWGSAADWDEAGFWLR